MKYFEKRLDFYVHSVYNKDTEKVSTPNKAKEINKMFCTDNYSKISKKWVVSFYDDDGMRNNRKAEFFDRELEATNRICELMATEDITYIPPAFENRVISAIHDAIVEYESIKTCLLYTSPSPRDPKTSRMPSSA